MPDWRARAACRCWRGATPRGAWACRRPTAPPPRCCRPRASWPGSSGSPHRCQTPPPPSPASATHINLSTSTSWRSHPVTNLDRNLGQGVEPLELPLPGVGPRGVVDEGELQQRAEHEQHARAAPHVDSLDSGQWTRDTWRGEGFPRSPWCRPRAAGSC